MEHGLKVGLEVNFSYPVPEERTVPHVLPESPEMSQMPRVLATGFLVALCEWACIQAINPHIDWPRQMTVGIGVDLTHEAATPPGLTVRITGRLEEVEGRLLLFSLTAHDGVDLIARGAHRRAVIDTARFNEKAARKKPSL